MPYNRVTRSVLEIRSPHFYALSSQAPTAQKRLGFVFLRTDKSNWVSKSLVIVHFKAFAKKIKHIFKDVNINAQNDYRTEGTHLFIRSNFK